MGTKHKSLQLHAFDVDTWWNLVQDMFQIGLQVLCLMSTKQMKPTVEKGLKHTWKNIQNSNMNDLL